MGTTMMPASLDEQRALKQRHTALKAANHIRIERARIKHDLRLRSSSSSCVVAAGLIWDPPEELRGMPVTDLLMAVRGVGSKAAKRLLRVSEASEKKLGDLTSRQRAGLAAVLRYRAEFAEPADLDRAAA